jgi:hypothetical protein
VLTLPLPLSVATADGSAASLAQSRMLVGAFVAIFACRVLIASVVVPPWQGPDEPTHFALAQQLARPDGRTPLVIRQIERDLLQSMATHGWWHYYQEPTPAPVPHAFSQVPAHLYHGTLDQPVYYAAAAAVLRPVQEWSVDQQYFVLRTFSILLTAFTIAFGWLGTRTLFGTTTAIGALGLVTMHPQFLLTAVSVNPDVMINFCGALVWWQVARIRTSAGWGRVLCAAVMIVAVVVAAFSKRNGLPLGVIAMAASAAALGMPVRRALGGMLGVSLFVVAGVAAIVYGSDTYSESARRLLAYWSSVFSPARIDTSGDRIVEFASMAIDSGWLVAGWLRFPAPDIWLWVARAVTIAGFAGAVAALRRHPQRQQLRIAALFVAIHFGSLLAVTFIAGSVPQGRYLFAALFPAAVLIWSGLLQWVPPEFRSRAMTGLLALAATLDATGFLLVLFPTYLQ